MIDASRIKSASHLALTDIHYQRLGGDLVVWARPNWSNDEAWSYFIYAAPSETKIIAEAMSRVGMPQVRVRKSRVTSLPYSIKIISVSNLH